MGQRAKEYQARLVAEAEAAKKKADKAKGPPFETYQDTLTPDPLKGPPVKRTEEAEGAGYKPMLGQTPLVGAPGKWDR